MANGSTIRTATGPRIPGSPRCEFIGRAEELASLSAEFARPASGPLARTVMLVGPSGVGKTRLIHEALARVGAGLSGERGRVVHCIARERGASLHLARRLLRERFQLAETLDPEEAGLRLRTQVAELFQPHEVLDVSSLIGHVIGLRVPQSPLLAAVGGDGASLRSVLGTILCSVLERDAARSPSGVVVILDQLDRADPESLALIESLFAGVKAPVLFVCAHRPELMAKVPTLHARESPGYRLIEVAPLRESDATAMMQRLLAPCREGDVRPLVTAACAASSGLPGMLERMVSMYFDCGVLTRGDDFAEEVWEVHLDRFANLSLPRSAADVVVARLAALSPPERRVLEHAACVGTVFWLGSVISLGRLDAPSPELWTSDREIDRAEVSAILADLCARDYIVELPESSFGGDTEYAFKQSLERKTLRSGIAGETLARWHLAVADWLSFRITKYTPEDTIAMLAKHLERGGQKSHAASTYLRAADVARSQYLLTRAAELYERGLMLFGGPAEARQDRRIEALHNYGSVLQSLGQNDAALSAFREMLAIAFRINLKSKGGAAHNRIGRLHRELGRFDEASTHLHAALELYEQAVDQRGIASALDDIGKLHWLRGDYSLALDYTQRSLSMRRRLVDRQSIALSLHNLGLIYHDMGEFRLALESFEQALGIRNDIGDRVGVALTLASLGRVAHDQQDDQAACELFRSSHHAAIASHDRKAIATALTYLGETLAKLSVVDEAFEHLGQAHAMARDLGDKLLLAQTTRGLARCLVLRGEKRRARDRATEAVSAMQDLGSRVELGVSLRTLGEILVQTSAGEGDLRLAMAHISHSLELFDKLGNHAEILRSLRAFLSAVEASPSAHDANTRGLAVAYRARADQIHARMQSRNAP